ncbi:MAG: DUF1800 domain-containing protein [Rhodospirillales bacterium]|nr:DUF1800 domain-containing protein [Alphaproteobacteria bacterium]MCB9977665.1 DUF1800 domain-containing protein [Rhodospirillales bacterium]
MSREIESFIVLNRFGYGPDSLGLSAFKASSMKFLVSQLEHPEIPKHLADKTGIELSHRFLTAVRANKAKDVQKIVRKDMIKDYTSFVSDIVLQRMQTKQPFVERLVAFWSNHFTVSIDKPAILGLLRDYEYVAIRPHITGKFEDLLIAVVKHPAMLAYLDNWQSFGPNTWFAKFSRKGLNENLAREIMELHTLGVDGGYTQQDVIELAKMLTGWSIEMRNRKEPYPKFQFHDKGHEPGPKTLLGRTYKEDGMNEAIAALKMLATHPKTARRLATKMAVHFISDQPPERLVRKMESAYLRSGGNLGAMTRAMLDAPESWAEPLSKVKTTPDYIVSTFRAINFTPKEIHTITSLDSLDYKPYKASSPQGFSDENEYWAAPGALIKRTEWAQEVAMRIMQKVDPFALGKGLFGPVMSAETAFALKGAESQKQGLTLLLMSPEFQRR